MSINKISNIRIWSAWTILVLFYAYQYILRVIPNILLPYMQEKFGVDGLVFGQFSGVYYTGYALAHIPFGILVGRYGLKKILPWAFILSASGLWPIIYSESWAYPLIGRALTGIGSSCSIIAVFHFLAITFPAEKFSKLLSIMVSIGLIAAIYGSAPLAYLVEKFGCQTIMNALMFSGVMLSILSHLIFYKEDEEKSVNISEAWRILSNKRVVLIALASGLMVGALEGFPDAWGAAFLSMKYNLTTAQAAQVTSYIFLGMLVGCPFCSWWAGYKKRYFQVIMTLGAVMATGFFITLTIPDLPYIVLSSIFVLIGICCSYQVPAIYMGSSFVPQKFASLTATLINMIIMTFGHIMHTMIGGAVETFGGLKSLPALEKSLLIIPFVCSLGVFLLFIIWRKNLNHFGSQPTKRP